MQSKSKFLLFGIKKDDKRLQKNQFIVMEANLT